MKPYSMDVLKGGLKHKTLLSKSQGSNKVSIKLLLTVTGQPRDFGQVISHC